MPIDFDNARHPDWSRMIRRWQAANDFWRGGIHVLQPEHPATDVLIAKELHERGADGEDVEPPMEGSVYEWRTVPSRSYLWKHAREATHEYDDRSRRVINLPVFQYVCNTLASGVLKQNPTRDGMLPFWKDFHTDADLCGTDIDAFMRRALSLALVHGRVHAVVDRRRFDTPANSRLEQQVRGEVPYTYLVLPQDLVDWGTDSYGNMEWAVIAEPEPNTRGPGEVPESRGPSAFDVPSQFEKRLQYRVWTKDSWYLYVRNQDSKSEDKWSLLDSGEHGSGEVPVYTMFCTRYPDPKEMACESPVADVLDLNRDILNKLSELDEVERSQTFGVMAIPTLEGLATGGFDIGPFRAITYPSAAGPPTYLDPNPHHPNGKWDRIGEKLFTGRQLAGVGRGKSEFSKEERSASAIAAEADDKKNQLSWWAKSLQEFDQKVHDAVGRLQGVPSPTVAYSNRFDIKGTMVEVQEVMQLASIDVMADSRRAVSTLLSPIVRRMLSEQGVDPAEIDSAVENIRESGEKQPEVEAPPEVQGSMDGENTAPEEENADD